MKVKLRVLFLFVNGLICAFTFGQDSVNHQIELSHDNDFILLSDRYYSSGLFISYRKKVEKGLFGNDNGQFDFKLGQEVYTHKQPQSESYVLQSHRTCERTHEIRT